MGTTSIFSAIVIQPVKTWRTQRWKVIFIASFIGTANLYLLLVDPSAIDDRHSARQLSAVGHIVTGFLIGFGTKLGNGCTCGHGICGLSRLSRRSLAAVCTFMGVGMATATLFSLEAVQSRTMFLYADFAPPSTSNPVVAVVVGILPVSLALFSVVTNRSRKSVGAAMSGALFAVGLAVSKMVLPNEILGFLDLSRIATGTYDPSVMLVMASGLGVGILGYICKQEHLDKKPLLADEYCISGNTAIDLPLLLGASLFGIGWGVSGLCPGPAMFSAAVGVPPICFSWLPAFYAGSYLGSMPMS
ncbi:hypothetical protein MHU86_10982 [Fragilaria crotonensis]|nr:hypothetical protein MHU86_10982 [Fragilaria crotonensis]